MMCLEQLVGLSLSLALCFDMALATPIKPESKMVVGVPIFNYQNRYYTAEEPRRLEEGNAPVTDWMLILKREYSTDDDIRLICHAQGRCLAMGNPSQGGVAFVLMQATDQELESVLGVHGSHVDYVEPDAPMHLIPDLDDNTTMEVAGQVASWGLDRIDDRKGLDGSYAGAAHGGRGVHVYVVDTGIRTTHETFGGRAFPAVEIVGNQLVECGCHNVDCAVDRNGHGTHCAGTIGGDEYGVARGVTLHAVKVLGDNGGGSWSGLVQVLDWVAANGHRPAVISASLGGGGIQHAVGRAVESATKAGVTVVVAAGNSKMDACRYSPAYAPSALTVGATDSVDAAASFNNYGKCVDVLAPGVQITSAWSSGDTSKKSISGTSMATPHVSGAAALLLQVDPSATPAQIASKLKAQATVGAVSDTRGSPNLLLYVDTAATPSKPSLRTISTSNEWRCTTTTTTTKAWLPISGFCGFEDSPTPYCGWHRSMENTKNKFRWERKDRRGTEGSHYLSADASSLKLKYKDMGGGKCLHLGKEPESSFHQHIGLEACHNLCSANPRCGGYSVSTCVSCNNCIEWLATPLTGGGQSWGGAHCYVKEQPVDYVAVLKAPTLPLMSGGFFSFHYRMGELSSSDSLKVQVESTRTGKVFELWSKFGSQGYQWRHERVSLDKFSGESVVVSIIATKNAVQSYKHKGDIGIDDMMVSREWVATTTKKVPEVPYYALSKGSCCCPELDRILAMVECGHAHEALGLQRGHPWNGGTDSIPGGCSTRQSHSHNLHWNTVEPGRARSDMTPICKRSSTTTALPKTTSFDAVNTTTSTTMTIDVNTTTSTTMTIDVPVTTSMAASSTAAPTTVTTTTTEGTATPPTVTTTTSPTISITSGDTIFLKTRSGNGNYIDVEGTTVQARWQSQGHWQSLIIEKERGGIVRSGDVVYLKAHTGAHVDAADEAVRARWNETGNWQAMTIQKKGGSGVISPNDVVCLIAHTGKHLDVEDGIVRARWQECGDWQSMRIEKEVAGALFSGDSVLLRAHTGNLIEVDGDYVGARWAEAGTWQTLTIQNYGGRVISAGDIVFLKAHTGLLLHVQDAAVLSKWNDYGDWQKFVIEKKGGAAGPIMPGDTVFMRAHTGRFIEVDGGAVQARWDDQGLWQSLVVEKSSARRLTETHSRSTSVEAGREKVEHNDFVLV